MLFFLTSDKAHQWLWNKWIYRLFNSNIVVAVVGQLPKYVKVMFHKEEVSWLCDK